jgi:hypothetical protein
LGSIGRPLGELRDDGVTVRDDYHGSILERSPFRQLLQQAFGCQCSTGKASKATTDNQRNDNAESSLSGHQLTRRRDRGLSCATNGSSCRSQRENAGGIDIRPGRQSRSLYSEESLVAHHSGTVRHPDTSEQKATFDQVLEQCRYSVVVRHGARIEQHATHGAKHLHMRAEEGFGKRACLGSVELYARARAVRNGSVGRIHTGQAKQLRSK